MDTITQGQIEDQIRAQKLTAQTNAEQVAFQNDNYEYLNNLTNIGQNAPEELKRALWPIFDKNLPLANLNKSDEFVLDNDYEMLKLELEMSMPAWEYDPNFEEQMKCCDMHFHTAKTRAREGFERKTQITRQFQDLSPFRQIQQKAAGGLRSVANKLLGRG